ncbi:MAG: glycoside hydrolase family 127 protein [Oscillospiraceae bacterium]|nr:glycoside hydrolase family 127 protein [Oscillospiraceae bacterium]
MNNRLSKPALRDIKLDGPFWGYYRQLLKNEVADYQLDAADGKAPGYQGAEFIRNYRLAAGLEEGEHKGLVFCDSDVSKIMEFVAYVIEANGGDAHLEKRLDDFIEIAAKAQMDDGYCITYFINTDISKRWTNMLECHELYSAGHLIEAAVAYFNATGKRNYLDIAVKFADHIDSVIGLEEGKMRGYCNHPEIELALVKLYHATNDRKYLNLAKYFIDQRGTEPYYYAEEWERGDKISYFYHDEMKKPLRKNDSGILTHLPVREQLTAEGHAVRAVYLYAGMADVAAETGDDELFESCRTLYDNITKKRQFISGGVGSTYQNEAFLADYFLPNDCYCETCAAIGFMLFAHRMFGVEKDSKYMDSFERTLYNNGLSGMSQDGRHYFYVNSMETSPAQWAQDGRKSHLGYNRDSWQGCGCCPPNVARFIASVGQYVYSFGAADSEIYVNLYAENKTSIDLNGNSVKIAQNTNYPWDEHVKIVLNPAKEEEFSVKLRMPAWCKNPEVKLNGVKYAGLKVKGYMDIKRAWKKDDEIEIIFPMPVELYSAHPSISDNINKLAVMRGPVLYCAEETDNGKELHRLLIDKNTQFENVPDKTGRFMNLIARGYKIETSNYGDDLYSADEPYIYDDQRIVLVPFYTWNNRGEGEMRVWLSKKL